MGDNEFEQDLRMDKYSLDLECLNQPRLFTKWADKLADAVAERDRADQKVEVVKAEVEQSIRVNPQKYGIDKVTEATIKSYVTTSQEVNKAIEDWIQAKHVVGLLMSAKEAMEQRKSMLEELVKLYLSGYWADPKIPKESKEEMSNRNIVEQGKLLQKRPKK